MAAQSEVRAWDPRIAGVVEVFHARFVDHGYPSHTHNSWTLLIVDSGAIGFGVAGTEHDSVRSTVTLLPPHVPHDGRTVTTSGFRKRVVYLEEDVLDGIGAAVDTPTIGDPLLRDRVSRLHESVTLPGEELEAQSRLAFVRARLQAHLRPRRGDDSRGPWDGRRDPSLAGRLRDLLDARTVDGLTLEDAGTILGTSPTHLIRSFTHEFGIPPHKYLVGRRVEMARRLLLTGMPVVDVAAASGFYDQAHLHRHFRRFFGATPGGFARRDYSERSVSGSAPRIAKASR